MAAFARAWYRPTRNDQLVLAVLAVVVGAAAGYGSVALRWLAWLIQDRFDPGLQPCSPARPRR